MIRVFDIDLDAFTSINEDRIIFASERKEKSGLFGESKTVGSLITVDTTNGNEYEFQVRETLDEVERKIRESKNGNR